MMPRRVMVLSICAVLYTALPGQVLAEFMPTLSIRHMTIEADEIVVGEPADPKAGVLPSRYKAISVLKGKDIRVGQEIVVRNEVYQLGPPEWSRKPGAKKSPVQIVKALLFLKRPTKDAREKGYRTVLSGIRALAKSGELLVPQQTGRGGLYLLPKKGQDWDTMLAQVRSDLPKIAKIREIGTIRDRRKRNKAIFEWIEKHKKEFGGGSFFGGWSKGWATLEPQLFNWLMESCIHEDCWRAIELSAELGTGPNGTYPSFCSPRGRELLMAKVFDKKLPDSLRLRALRELGGGISFWYSHSRIYPSAEMVTRKEQEEIIARVKELLSHTDPTWRIAAARCLMSASWPYDANFKHMLTKQAIPNLAALYRNERKGGVRRQIVEAIRKIEDEAFWKDLSGNPHGIVVFVQFEGIEQGALKFRLVLTHTRAKLTAMPILRLEKLNTRGKVTETRTVKPGLLFPKNIFNRGWERWMAQPHVKIPLSKVQPGLWRVAAEGRVGKEETKWRSEPTEITIPEPGQWWINRQAGFIGAILGVLGGCLGAMIGILSGCGKARRLVLGLMKAMFVTGLARLVLAVVALVLSQPYAVYYSPLLSGILLTILPIAAIRSVRKRYEQIELRKMKAMDR